jgi:hypothetical protein
VNRGIKQIIYGIIVIAVTAIITMVAVVGNFGIIFYGAFIVGIILIIKGIINLIRDGIRMARKQ